MSVLDVEAGLRELLASISETPLDLDDPAVRGLSVWQLGLTSSDVVRLLSGIEDRFGVEWDLDSPPEALASYTGLVAHVERQISS